MESSLAVLSRSEGSSWLSSGAWAWYFFRKIKIRKKPKFWRTTPELPWMIWSSEQIFSTGFKAAEYFRNTGRTHAHLLCNSKIFCPTRLAILHGEPLLIATKTKVFSESQKSWDIQNYKLMKIRYSSQSGASLASVWGAWSGLRAKSKHRQNIL